MNENEICPVCQGTFFDTVIHCNDHAVSHETFSLKQCASCKFLLTYPRPPAADVPRYYDSPAYISHVGRATTLLDLAYQAVRGFTLKWKLSLIKKKLPHDGEKSILDYGCGTGEFLRIAKLGGWKITGIEPSSSARKNASKNISANIKASIDDIEGIQPQFNIITLWHVLEHVENLNETIERLKGMLTTNGAIFVAVPNHRSWDSSHYKEFWAGYDVPRHLWHFDKKSIALIANNHGLKIAEIIPMRLDAFYICILSERYMSPNTSSIGRLFKAITNGLQSSINASQTTEHSSLIYVLTK